MRPGALLREAVATAWAAKIPTALVCALVAIMCAATLATVGRTAAAQDQVLERLDSAGARLLVITDTGTELLGAAVIDQTRALSVVERAIGARSPVDVTNGVVGAGGARAPAWMIVGDPSDAVTLTQGRWPRPGEALISAHAQHTLGMDHPVGVVDVASTTNPASHNVVGAFTPLTPFEDYATGVLIAAPPVVSAVDSLHVITTGADVSEIAQRVVLGLIDPPRLDDLTVHSPLTLAQVQDEITGDLTTFGRALLLGVLGAGAILIAVIVLADVLLRRSDLGRRRALGATRTTILALVVTRTLLAAILGACLGTATGLAIAAQYGPPPPWNFTVGTAALALLAALISTLPPALLAATRDPVRVLRTP